MDIEELMDGTRLGAENFSEVLDMALMIETYIFFAIYTTILIIVLCKVNNKLFLGFGAILLVFEFYFFIKSALNTLFFI